MAGSLNGFILIEEIKTFSIHEVHYSLLVLPSGALANKKGPCYLHGPFVCWLPRLLSQSVLLWAGMKLKMVRVAKGHTKIVTQRNLKPSESWMGVSLTLWLGATQLWRSWFHALVEAHAEVCTMASSFGMHFWAYVLSLIMMVGGFMVFWKRIFFGWVNSGIRV